MNYLMKKAVNYSGQDMLLDVLDIDFAHRTMSIVGEIDEEVAAVVNSALRSLAQGARSPQVSVSTIRQKQSGAI